jgi:hypothetical protein
MEVEYIMLLEKLYKDIIQFKWKVPCITDIFAYDERFNTHEIIKLLIDNDNMCDCSVYWYKNMFNELTSNNQFIMKYIFDSSDFNEPPECGDYSYYYSYIGDTPYLLMDTLHPWAYPYRIILYDPKYEIRINADSKDIEILESVTTSRRIFMMNNESQRLHHIKKYIKNTDRPSLIT